MNAGGVMGIIYFYILTLFCCFSAEAAWKAQDVAISLKINKYSNSNTVSSLKSVEKLVSRENLSKFSADMNYEQIKDEHTPPFESKKPSLDSSVDLSPKTLGPKGGRVPGIAGLISVALPLFKGDSAQQLSPEARKNIYDRMKNLVSTYQNPASTEYQKQVIKNYFSDYLGLDLDLSDEDLVVKDQDMIELQQQGDVINLKISESLDHVESEIKSTIDNAQKNIIDEMNTAIDQNSKEVLKNLEEESQSIKDAIGLNEEEQKTKLDYLVQKQLEKDFDERIAKIKNYEELDAEIEKIETNCANKVDEVCGFQTKKLERLKELRNFHFRQDLGYASVQSLKTLQQIAYLFGDEKLAHDLSKAVFVVETGQKIIETALNLGMQSSLAAIGDVASMASMAMSIAGVFGSSGDSAEAQILEQLMLIRKAIQELREEMHERFDLLSLQLQGIGMSLDLKIQSADEKFTVIIDNQQMIETLIKDNQLSILNLTELIMNQQLNNKLSELIELGNKTQLNNNEKLVHEYLSNATSTFASYFDYSEMVNLDWKEFSASDFDLNSSKAIQVIAMASADSPQKNFTNFSLIDYIIKSSVGNQLGGQCVSLDFNELYLFNVLGEALLPSLRSVYRNKNTLIFEDKNKYLNYLKKGDLDQVQAIGLLEEPLLHVNSLIKKADNCLNSFQMKDKKSQNVIAYLLDQYHKAFREEVDKVFFNIRSGRAKEDLRKAILDVTQPYFQGLNQEFIAFDETNPKMRSFIDIDTFPLLSDNPLADDIDKLFFEKFKTISSCHAYQVPADPKLVETYKPIQMPAKLLNLIFPSEKTKLSILLGLNPLKLCYMQRIAYEKEFEANEDSLIAALELRLFSHANSGKFPYYTQPSIAIPLFLPLSAFNYQSKIYEHRYTKPRPGKNGDKNKYAEETMMDIATTDKHMWEIESTSFSESASHFLKDAIWKCSKIVDSLNTCQVEGFDFANERQRKIHTDFVANTPKDNFTTTQLNALRATEVYETLRKELMTCSKQMLMGFNSCQFATFKSIDSINNLMNLKRLNNISRVIRLLAPMISSFKEGVTDDQKKNFIIEIERYLQEPIEVIAETANSDGDFINNFTVQIEQMDKGFETLAMKANRDLYIDTKSLLNTNVYGAIEFYLGLTKEVFQDQLNDQKKPMGKQ
jgi:hypothetical protein